MSPGYRKEVKGNKDVSLRVLGRERMPVHVCVIKESAGTTEVAGSPTNERKGFMQRLSGNIVQELVTFLPISEAVSTFPLIKSFRDADIIVHTSEASRLFVTHLLGITF